MFAEIINLYGSQIIGTLLLALAGTVAVAARNLALRYLDTDTKRTLAKTVVQFTEQVCKDLHGEDKLAAAMKTLSELLMQKGIPATETELTVLIEAAVAEFNDVFYRI